MDMLPWVKLSDRTPDEFSDVIVTDGNDIKIMWWNGIKWDSWEPLHSIDSDMVTHWMQLPSPPQD